MRFTQPLSYLSTFTAILGLAGCAGTKPPYKVIQDPYGAGQVQVADKDMDVVFDPPRVTFDEADLMSVTLPIRSATSRPQIIQYRTHFYDREKKLIYTTAWRTETLESNVHQELKVTSTTREATSFKIDVREAR